MDEEPARGVAIAVAPNGGSKTKADHPGLPLGPAELARTAAECAEAGAAMIHVHVRDADGGHLLDADAYAQVIAAIEGTVGDRLVVQITSEALGRYSPAQQAAIIRAVKPEAVSLALREFVPEPSFEAGFADLLHWMKRHAVMPQIILYDPGEAVYLAGLIGRGLVPWDHVPVLFVLGRYAAGQRSAPTDLLPFLAPGIPRFRHWSVCAFGRNEAACVTAAALLGGHIRVGFENNLLLPDGRVAESNAALVRTAATAVGSVGLGLLTAAGIRSLPI
ncbi:3-keto-5-aminohexanoate cleavage protein [Inquilinus sp.]|jgi:3-keto-5-aminohexanoate cleavage enzyme|uniref:3-keto-5-aminohexanoate cleavage protein n=1 Tax=Inquilinus sp. TaxID=1932117 RepID=UPI0037848879